MAARTDRVLELVAQRQARRRAFNARLARLESPDDELLIRCECGLIGCGAGIRLGEDTFAALYDTPHHFAVLVEHVMPEAERIVAEHGAWVTVETTVHPPAARTISAPVGLRFHRSG
jgi:hypothetical protein